VNELYPGRSVIVCEMLAAWKDRNRWRRLKVAYKIPMNQSAAADRCDAKRQQLAALRRVWRALRAIR